MLIQIFVIVLVLVLVLWMIDVLIGADQPKGAQLLKAVALVCAIIAILQVSGLWSPWLTLRR